jgi:flagellar hook assembly protein FlgD
MIGTITGSEIFKVKQVSATDFATSVNYVIPAGGTINFEIMLNTTTIGTYNADLVVSADDPVTSIVTIPLTAVVLPVANGDQNAVIVTALKGNYPNPFNPETSIFYSVKGDAKVNVTIYNLLGQKVKTLVNGNTKSGNHSIKWNGKDDAGRNVTSGVYFYRMEAGKYTSTQKMILMK